MFTKKILSAALGSWLLLVCSVIAGAQERTGRLAKLKDYLALTDTQVTEISGLLGRHREAVFPLRRDQRARSREVQNALDTPEPNPHRVGQLVIVRNGLNKQLRALKVRLQSDIAAVLTPDQKLKFERLRERAGRRGLRR